ncbi:8-amino-7-oxononanoate synthase [Leptolyngbyaceae cyanobacterium CCMR0082]|uniref:8-amino-7-ketopelargonate synthase n=1 Tax=Adonisia turfae CCMR0082 TaxID=2304604 RepID=A0A6M0SE00_9CYAN|nr:8-amino-7-oxononanoate synthase [Adonisia turfae]MDV3352728.1 8-amino-7-oxononanoate synthase [Leptothoe sp. LEGE 181152]NEZ65892.1 8-amino-7-oxononanoate synthase [Adonisia turfae CCMR0082]
MVATNPYGWITKSLQTLQRANWYRQVQTVDGKGGATISVNGHTCLNFASNDYLGLAGDPRLAKAAANAIATYGTGSTGSRLLSGQRPIHRELEQAIAELKGTDDAIVFSSGYLANLGTLATLVDHRDLIVADQYNHSSLQMGARLSGATIAIYDHNNLEQLQHHLTQMRPQYRRCIIVTDSVFSMDGDLCPLSEILAIADQWDTMVMVDEAHGTGVLGKTGGGAVELLGCRHRPMVQVGTLSKALGSLGGYVTGSAELIDFLRNRAATWIYTTGLSPADAAAARTAIAILSQEPERLTQLAHNATYLRQRLDQLSHISRLPSESPIVCIQVKDAATVLQLGQHLKKQGIFASAVRPPTVPTSRLRATVMATHSRGDIDRLVAGIQDFFGE